MLRIQNHKTLVALGVMLSIFWSPPAKADPWTDLYKASARIRIGDAIGALELLAELNADAYEPEARHVYGILHARALVVGGLYTTAEKILAPLLESPDPATTEALFLLALRSNSALRRVEGTRKYAEKLLELPGISPHVRVEAEFRLAESLAWHGSEKDVQSAENMLKALAKDRHARGFRPAIIELMANIGTPGAQTSRLRRLVIEYGETPEGIRASRTIPLNKLDDQQRLSRARNLYKARAYDLAQTSFESVLKVPSMKQEALIKIGTIRTRMRDDYPAAVRIFTEAANGKDPKLAHEAWFRLGVSLGYLNRFDEAIEAMRTCSRKEPKGAFARDASYQIGRLNHEAGRFRKAAKAHEDFVRNKKRRDPKMWLWFLGWSHYRAKDYAKARGVFSQMKNDTNQLVGAKALYWTARAFLHEGMKKKAKLTLETLFRRAPLGYYGLLGRQVYQKEFDSDGPRFPLRPQGYPLARRPRPDIKKIEDKTRLPSLKAGLKSIRLLLAAGFPRMAQHKSNLLRLEERLEATSSKDDWKEAKVTLDVALERFRPRWTRLAPKRLAWREKLSQQRQEDVRETFPLAFEDMAVEAGRLYGVDSRWLMAHMLQESRYFSNAISGAGALGLLQILPRTGARIAARLGFPKGPFNANYLFDSGISIRYAAWYLDALRSEFSGNVILSMAAYNGGPLLIGQHVRNRPDLPMDLMIEEIGPHESRNYARKVTDHLVRYANIYLDDVERERVLTQILHLDEVAQPKGELRF